MIFSDVVILSSVHPATQSTTVVANSDRLVCSVTCLQRNKEQLASFHVSQNRATLVFLTFSTDHSTQENRRNTELETKPTFKPF